jgi:hypothetical protein
MQHRLTGQKRQQAGDDRRIEAADRNGGEPERQRVCGSPGPCRVLMRSTLPPSALNPQPNAAALPDLLGLLGSTRTDCELVSGLASTPRAADLDRCVRAGRAVDAAAHHTPPRSVARPRFGQTTLVEGVHRPTRLSATRLRSSMLRASALRAESRSDRTPAALAHCHDESSLRCDEDPRTS